MAFRVEADDSLDLAERVFPALVRIEATGQDSNNNISPPSFSTGFVSTKSGHIITTTHLLEKLPYVTPESLRMKITLGAVEMQEVDKSAIVLRDDPAGILVLKSSTPITKRQSLCVLPKKEEKSIKLNDTLVYSLGFPVSVPYVSGRGIISSFDGAGNAWLSDVLIYDGMQGGPIYTASGQVIGIAKGANEKIPGLYELVPISNVRARIEDFITDCVQNKNTKVSGKGQRVDVARAELPSPSECVFLGKLSVLQTDNEEDAPFGKNIIRRIASDRQTASSPDYARR